MIGEDFTYLLSSHELIEIAKAALRSPTGDNAQPFSVKWSKEGLEIYHNHQRAHHHLNYRYQASLISLGCLLEATDIQASQFGLETMFEFPTEKFEIDSLWAIVKFKKTNRKPDELIEYIFKRYTDRRPYSKIVLSEEEKKWLVEHPNIDEGRFSFSDVGRDLSQTISDMEEYVWEESAAVSDLLKWVRLDQNEVKNSKDGMGPQSMNLNIFEILFFKIIRRCPFIIKLIYHLGLRRGLKQRNQKILNHSSGIIIFSLESVNSRNFILTGQRIYRLWLNLFLKGHVAQPVFMASGFLTAALYSEPLIKMKKKHRKMFLMNEQKLKSCFNLQEKDKILWMFRYGNPINGSTSFVTPRLDLDQFLIK